MRDQASSCAGEALRAARSHHWVAVAMLIVRVLQAAAA